jgi:hypothetical protein
MRLRTVLAVRGSAFCTEIMPMDKPPQQYLYPWHRKSGTGMAFREWLRRGTELPKQGSISLMQISAAVGEEFAFNDNKDWHEAMKLCIAELLRSGHKTALYNYDSDSWEWTDRFNLPDDFGIGPEGVAAAAIQSWVAFGDSGGAEDLRFAIELPAEGPPAPQR